VVCKLVIKPPKDSKALFLDRQKQGHLQSYLSEQLSYTPFVFNAVIGVFIFTKKNQATETLALWVTHFLEARETPSGATHRHLSRSLVFLKGSRWGYWETKRHRPWPGKGILTALYFK
jgi:hypothetical protein